MAMNMLAYYAQKVAETRGLRHQLMLQALRRYIKETDEKILIQQIKETYRTEQLRAMWEAGLSAALQEAVLARLEELEQRRG